MDRIVRRGYEYLNRTVRLRVVRFHESQRTIEYAQGIVNELARHFVGGGSSPEITSRLVEHVPAMEHRVAVGLCTETAVHRAYREIETTMPKRHFFGNRCGGEGCAR